MPEPSAVLALHRFGLGARPGDIEALRGDVREALLGEVAGRADLAHFQGLPQSHDALSGFLKYRGMRRVEREEAAAMRAASRREAMAGGDAGQPTSDSPPKPTGEGKTPATAAKAVQPNPLQVLVRDEIAGRINAAVAAEIGFRERLVLFWANHFTVAGPNPRVRLLCGAFEREVIRPLLAGRFEDLLQAAVAHPAMLLYLDNAQSFGPNSQIGRNRKRGLNENLAREILELHTLGVDGGYTQDDVTRFAEVLTGWTVVAPLAGGGPPGSFTFRPHMHEPGERRLLGRVYAAGGEEQGRAVLRDLASHPATARHLARKIARHFVADEPPPALIARLEAAYLRSGGQLMQVYKALLDSPEAWEESLRKLRPPYPFVLAIARALGATPDAAELMRAVSAMGQPVFAAPSPKGWPEEAAAWTAPHAFKTRLDTAELMIRRWAHSKPLALAESVLGRLLSDETRTAIRRAESGHQAVTLLVMSPEFQRS